MKHNIEDCKIKLGVREDVDEQVIVMLAEQIQQDTELLEGEDE